MKNIILAVSLLFFVISYSQKDSLSSFEKERKTTFKFTSGLNTSLIVINTKLTDKWSFQNELLFTQIDENQFGEMPLLLKYTITKRWSLFFGPKLDVSLKNKYGGDPTANLPIFGVSAAFGSRYNFDNHFFGEIRFDHSFTKKMSTSALGFKNTTKGEVIKFKIGRHF